MGKTEYFGSSEELVTTEIVSDIDTITFANILGVTKLYSNFLYTAQKNNRFREDHFVGIIKNRIEYSLKYEEKPSVQEAVRDFQIRKESESIQQIVFELKMYKMGLKNPTKILDLLGNNSAFDTFYDIDFSEANPKVISFNYEKINSDFLKFIAEFDNPILLLDRLNKLKVNLSLNDIEVQREKATELLKFICQIPEDNFQKAVNDLNAFSCIESCDIIHDYGDNLAEDKSLDKNFIARLRVLKKAGLTEEEKQILKSFDADSIMCPGINSNYGLDTVLNNKQFLKSLHIVLSEDAPESRWTDSPQQMIEKVKMLEEKGALDKLYAIFSSGITFSNRSDFKYKWRKRTVTNSIILGDNNNEILNLIDLAYENLTNEKFILMRCFLGTYTIDDSPLVKDTIELFYQTKKQIEELSPKEKKELFKSLSSNASYLSCVPDTIVKIWKGWSKKYDGSLADASKKIMQILFGILKLDEDITLSQLELAIKQDKRETDPKVREAISSINYREEIRTKINGEEFKILPIDTVRIDKDHVVGQCMDVIQISENKIRIQLFLTKNAQNRALEILQKEQYDSKFFTSSISYSDKEIVQTIGYKPMDGLSISIASDAKIRATEGLVDIHVDLSKVDKDTYIQEINSALSYFADLGSEENLLSSTDEESDRVLTQALYELNTKKLTPPDDIKFERRAVLDGYETVVARGRHKVLKEKYGSFVTFHRMDDFNHLPQILANGILSSHERYRRGMLIDGMSTSDDFKYGGANCVFTRTFSVDSSVDLYGVNLIFDPEIWDRLDFYIYDEDHFGDTREEMLKNRLAPDQYLSSLKGKKYERVDEQMFRRGISPDMIKGVVVGDLRRKIMLIEKLREVGIFNINGKSLDDFIFYDSDKAVAAFAAVDLAEGLPIGTTKEKRRKKESEILSY